MIEDYINGIPHPLSDELLAECRRDARSNNFRPEHFVLEHLGDRPREFDHEKYHDDRILTHQASSVSRRDDLRQDIDDSKHEISRHLPRKASGCVTLALLVIEWAICRDLFMNMGWSALAANGMALLVTIATAVAVGAVVPRPNKERS